MLLVDSFAQAYRWQAHYILSLTMPQIIMISHAADVNKKRMDERLNKKRKGGNGQPHVAPEDATWNGKPLTKLTSEEYLQYHRAGM